ncbi:MAG: bifunctional diaminohydroxyphosphoribosylaminopyrimidine deaminase/5-amino-6-(5-phosphoribosylamino)uracil reductase RibD [Ignavibacteriaceae bacterium]
MSDESYIKLAIEIAKKGIGSVSPNPLVGCVIVKNDRIISAGYHEKFGENHAEVNAIGNAKESLEGATLYTNLEPCSHHGKTPPCVDKIIEQKIKKVVVGTNDMNPLVSGNGIRKLKSAGIDVKVGIMENECIELNRFFFKYITEKIPYITLKAALTLDGRIADKSGDSKWISSLDSRKYVHQLRAGYDAVLVGYGTVKKDDPKLTVRLSEGRNPRRIILDTKLELNNKFKLLINNKDRKLIIVTSKRNADKKGKIKKILAHNADIVFVKEDANGRLNLKSVLMELAKINISSILVEGGREIYTSFIKKNLFDDIMLFVTPKLMGCGIPLLGNINKRNIKSALKLRVRNTERIGDDFLIELIK